MPDKPSRTRSVLRALEEARFGSERTLNLRASLPTPEDAVARADQWLRSQQAQKGGEVLLITGRGNRSIGGISVVRTAVERLLARLKRLGVVASVRENTPGSFVVTLAPLRTLIEAPRRQRGNDSRQEPVAELPGLDDETLSLLRQLSICALDRLGVRDHEKFLADEMRRQFSIIAAGLPSGVRRDEQLRAAIARALNDYEDSP